jgi:hypothetical protein
MKSSATRLSLHRGEARVDIIVAAAIEYRFE